jgi:hypothetical protein
MVFRATLPIVVLLLAGRLGSAGFPSDAEIKKLLSDRVGRNDQGAGLVVGMIDARGRRIVAYGNMSQNDKRAMDGDTIFEVGVHHQSIYVTASDGYGAKG